MQRSALYRSQRELSNAYLVVKIGFDTVENESCKVCPLSVYRSPKLQMLDVAFTFVYINAKFVAERWQVHEFLMSFITLLITFQRNGMNWGVFMPVRSPSARSRPTAVLVHWKQLMHVRYVSRFPFSRLCIVIHDHKQGSRISSRFRSQPQN